MEKTYRLFFSEHYGGSWRVIYSATGENKSTEWPGISPEDALERFVNKFPWPPTSRNDSREYLVQDVETWAITEHSVKETTTWRVVTK